MSVLNISALDPNLIEAIAIDLGVDESFVEKDWHAMQLLNCLQQMTAQPFQLVFSGGTSLSKAYQLIERFSEDLDFKILLPQQGCTRSQRSHYRKKMIELIRAQSHWSLLDDDILVGNASQFFSCLIGYNNQYSLSDALRPQLKLEVSFQTPTLPPQSRSLRSFIAQATQQPPEVDAMACVSPVETAADKICALAWRVLTRERDSNKDDPTLIRHLHDLTMLEQAAMSSREFCPLVNQTMQADFTKRSAAAKLPDNPAVQRLTTALSTLQSDTLYQTEYQQFVTAMSYARAENALTFEQTLASLQRIIDFIANDKV